MTADTIRRLRDVILPMVLMALVIALTPLWPVTTPQGVDFAQTVVLYARWTLALMFLAIAFRVYRIARAVEVQEPPTEAGR